MFTSDEACVLFLLLMGLIYSAKKGMAQAEEFCSDVASGLGHLASAVGSVRTSDTAKAIGRQMLDGAVDGTLDAARDSLTQENS